MGLYFLHEHPHNAKSWGNALMQELLRKEGVYRVRGDMCTWGMKQCDQEGEGLIKKPTGFLTNSREIAKILESLCNGDHRHIELIGGRAKSAEVYPDELCKDILKGLTNQMKVDERI